MKLEIIREEPVKPPVKEIVIRMTPEELVKCSAFPRPHNLLPGHCPFCDAYYQAKREGAIP